MSLSAISGKLTKNWPEKFSSETTYNSLPSSKLGGFHMKVAYPVIISKGEKYLLASVPDCEIDTQGQNLVDAMEMARDAISIWCVAELDSGRSLPIPSELSSITQEDGDVVTLVDADIEAYRKKLDNRTVRKNLTIPSWLNEEAERQHVNFSQVLQNALKEQLGTGA